MSIVVDIAAHEHEVSSGGRFQFGRNWARVLSRLKDARIAEAEDNLNQFPGEGSLARQTFLDIGSGSGLSSLAARCLSATVRSRRSHRGNRSYNGLRHPHRSFDDGNHLT